MDIQQFKSVSHINYGCTDMPECSVSLIARPGGKFKDPLDWHIFTRKIEALDYIYEFGAYHYGTADDVIKFYGCQLSYEFSKERDRHIFRIRPWAEVHFLDGSVHTIYFNNTGEATKFSQRMKETVGLNKHLLMDGDNFISMGEMRPFDDMEVINK